MKNKIPTWVLVICILGVIFYGYLICSGIFGWNEFKYEVDDDGTILIEKEKFTISKDITSYYDADKDTFYVVGNFKNETKKTYNGLSINFVIYDLNGNILGNASAYLDKIGSEETWRFKAVYNEIDAANAVSYKLIEVDYIR